MSKAQATLENRRQNDVHARKLSDGSRNLSTQPQGDAAEIDTIFTDEHYEDLEAPLITEDFDPSGAIDTSKESVNDANLASPPSWYEFVTVEPMIFLFNVAIMLANPVQVDMYLVHTCRDTLGYNASVCATLEGRSSVALETEVQPLASVFIMWARLIETCVPAVLTLFVGPWSDSNGRKLFLVLPVVGFSMKYIAYVACCFFPALPPSYLLLASVPVSLGGGLVSFISLYYCYISDITTAQQRGFRMGLLEACTYLGMLVGTAASTYVFNAGGNKAVFGASAALCCVAIIYAVCRLQESVANADSGGGLSNLVNCGQVTETLHTVCRKRGYGRRTIMFLIVIALASAVLAIEGESAVTFLFTRKKFDWDIGEFTTFGSVNILMQMLGTVVGVTVLSAWLGVSDAHLSVTSFALKVVSSVTAAVSPEPWYMYLAAAVSSLGAVAGPLCPAILSKTVQPQDVGKVFSLLTAAEAVAPLAAAPLYDLVYNATLVAFPGAVFILSAVLYMLDFVLLVSVCIIQRYNPEPSVTRIET